MRRKYVVFYNLCALNMLGLSSITLYIGEYHLKRKHTNKSSNDDDGRVKNLNEINLNAVQVRTVVVLVNVSI